MSFDAGSAPTGSEHLYTGSEWYKQVGRRIDPSDSIVCPVNRASSAEVTCSLAGDGQPYAAYQNRHPNEQGAEDADTLEVIDFPNDPASYLLCKGRCQAAVACLSIAHRAADGRCQLRGAAWSTAQVAALKTPTSSRDWATSYVYGDKLKR